MKKVKFLLIFIMIAMVSISCKKDDDDDINPIVGTWEVTETLDGDTISLEITFKENLSGILLTEVIYNGQTFSESDNFTWSTNGNKLTIVMNGETDTSTYSISGNKLTITDDGDDAVVFTKK